MSTFKRLLNIGKGKARAASKNLPTGLADGTDDLRHAAADAAEALADVIRPPADPPSNVEDPNVVDVPEVDEAAPVGPQSAPDPGPSTDSGDGSPTEEASPEKPRKRRL